MSAPVPLRPPLPAGHDVRRVAVVSAGLSDPSSTKLLPTSSPARCSGSGASATSTWR